MANVSSVLPNIAGLETIPRAKWEAFAERLRDVGLSDQYLASVSPRILRTRDAEPIISWHLRRRRDPAALLYRIFSMRDPVFDSDAVEALGAALFADFLRAGLVGRNPSGIVSNYDLQLVNGLYILCDDLVHGGDAVFGSGPGTSALCRSSSSTAKIPHSLDVGCGAGTVALWAARYSDRVLATDVNPRALKFVEINCALNGVTNIQTRLSDLFEAVSESSFDLITAQLPFVPDPGVDISATYRFGGSRGNELALRAISEAPRHLSSDGRCVVVFLQPIDARIAGPENDIDAHRVTDVRALLLLGPETDADAFSVRFAESQPGPGTEGFPATIVQMREHLNRLGISGLCPAVCVLQRNARAQGWTQRFGASGDLWRDVSATAINRILAAETLLHQPANLLLQARLRVPKGAVIVKPFESDTGQKMFLAGPSESLSKPLEFSQAEWSLVQSVNAAAEVESALTSCDVSEREVALLTISRVLRAGLFDVATREAASHQ